MLIFGCFLNTNQRRCDKFSKGHGLRATATFFNEKSFKVYKHHDYLDVS